MPRLNINGWPVTSEYDAIDSAHPIWHRHHGLDLGVPIGTPIPSIGDGIITQITDEGTKSFGKAIHLQMSDGSEVIYGHLSKFNVQVGQHVKLNSTLAFSGNSGDSTGPHVHIQVVQNGHTVDPLPYIQAAGGWVNKPGGLIQQGVQSAGSSFGSWLKEEAFNIIQNLNANAPEIVTSGIIVCGLGMMISPFIGSKGGNWFGRLMFVFWGGAIWCALR